MFNKKLKRRIAMQEKFIENRDDTIEAQKEKINKLKNQNKELEVFKNKVIETINQKATIVDKYDIIKELVSDYQS